MNIEIYDTNFSMTDILDTYESFLWNVKYNGYGDFILVVPNRPDTLDIMKMGYYICIPNSDRMMIIEKQQPYTNVDSGNTVSISGRSLESILLRRIIWTQTTISGNLQNAIKRLINEAIINPSISSRRISNFIFQDSTDTAVTSKTINETQFTGENLYDVIVALCKEAKLGFKITLNSSHQFVFQLYSGKNRTNSQYVNPTVEFSQNNDNLINSKYTIDTKEYCNVTLIAGEGEGIDRVTATYGSSSGLDRRELFTDARDISSNEGTEEEISPSEYQQLLIERGREKLNETIIKREFDSEVNSNDDTMYKFNSDYFLGDIVDFVDPDGRVTTNRIVEMTTTVTASEISTYPIFEFEEAV